MASINEFVQRYVVNDRRGLNLREEAEGRIVTVLPFGASVYGKAYKRIPEWMKVEVGELVGYVKSEFLREVNDA